jgi:hypothetical protein
MDEAVESQATRILLDFFSGMYLLGCDGICCLRSIDPEEWVEVDDLAEVRAVEMRRPGTDLFMLRLGGPG